MRQIKFRGKSIDTGEWLYGYFYKHNDKCYIKTASVGRFGDTFKVDTATVGQFTGLKDESGREIWEGDLVDTFIGELKVVWSNYDGEAGFRLQDDGGTLYNIRGMKMTVKGNIHDSTELMKG